MSNTNNKSNITNFKVTKGSNYDKITKLLKTTDGYCPCATMISEDTKCICKEFLEQDYTGECHCGRYKKELLDRD